MIVENLTSLNLYHFTWDIVDTNCYVIIESESVLIIDPIDSDELYSFFSGNNLQSCTVILTHAHFDHISGLNHLRSLFPFLKVICSEKCSENIQDPKRNLSSIANAYVSFQNKAEVDRIAPFICEPGDEVFHDSKEMKWENHSLKMIEVYGHSPDSICIIIDGRYLFSGDTVSSMTTVTRFPGGSRKLFWEHDIPMLSKMEGTIERVFPGHGCQGKLADFISINHN